MSRRHASAAPDGDVVQLASVEVAGERYAIDILRIKGVVRPQRVTPVPGAPEFVDGVIEMRGALVPVVDLRRRFGKPARDGERAARATKMVLVALGAADAGERLVVALVVDGVSEVLRVPRAAIRPAPALGRAASRFSGAWRDGDRLVLVLDLAAILSDTERADLAALDPDATPGEGAAS